MLYKESMQLRKKILGPNHPLYADTENDLGLLYSNMGRYAMAAPYLISSSRLFLQNMLNTFTILSEKEKGNFLQHNSLPETISFLSMTGLCPNWQSSFNLHLVQSCHLDTAIVSLCVTAKTRHQKIFADGGE